MNWRNNFIAYFVGSVGSGKSYHATKEIVEVMRKGSHVYTNIPLDAVYMEKHGLTDRYNLLDDDDLGDMLKGEYQYENAPSPNSAEFTKWKPLPNGTRTTPNFIVLDELGTFLNARDWKKTDEQTREFFKWLKEVRHHNCRAILIEQHFDNMSAQIRRLSEHVVHHRSLDQWQIWGITPIPAPVTICHLVRHSKGKEKAISTEYIFRGEYYPAYDSFGRGDPDSAYVHDAIEDNDAPPIPFILSVVLVLIFTYVTI